MKRRGWASISWISLLVLLAGSNAAQANDTAISSTPGRVQLLKNKVISMVSERITLRFDGPCFEGQTKKRGEWSVEAHYVFSNPTPKTQRVRLGFPESLCHPGIVDCAGKDPTFQNMVTSVRGVPVDMEIVEADRFEGQVVGRVWAYPVAFRPRERLDVVHRFNVVGSIDVAAARGISYLVSTGNNWATPIGHAKFIFLIPSYVTTIRHFPDQSWGSGPAPGIQEKSLKYVELDEGAFLELTYEAQDWSPPNVDVSIDFESGCTGLGLSWEPPAWEPRQRAREVGRPKQFCEWSDLRAAYAATDTVVSDLAQSDSDLATCAQAVQAMRGKPFQSEARKRYFYQGVTQPSKPPFPLFVPNPSYSPKFLTHADQRALANLKRAQAKREGPKAAPPATPPATPATPAQTADPQPQTKRDPKINVPPPRAQDPAAVHSAQVQPPRPAGKKPWRCAASQDRGYGSTLAMLAMLGLWLRKRARIRPRY